MQYQVKLKDIANEFSLEVITVPENYDDIYVRRADVSRPGLPLAGFFDDFESGRIQMIGNMEHSYLDSLGSPGRYESIHKFMAHDVVAVVVTRGLEIFPELKELAEKHSTPLFRTAETTSDFMASLIASLNVSLAERITRHGVLVEVYGEGVLILGDSGIGKSETNFIVKEPTAGQDGIVAAYRSLSAKDRKTVAEFVDFLIYKSAKNRT